MSLTYSPLETHVLFFIFFEKAKNLIVIAVNRKQMSLKYSPLKTKNQKTSPSKT